jgi:hypothetical protein
MAEPIIVDDGGSTRIKQLTNHTMDSLLDDHSDQAGGDFKNAGTAACTVTVVHIEGDDPTNPQTVTTNMVGLDSVQILSENDQQVVLTLNNAGKMDVQLSSSNGGADPMVEARQASHQRRYIVNNAGVILTVNLIRNNVTTQVYTKTNNTVYTMVHLVNP